MEAEEGHKEIRAQQAKKKYCTVLRERKAREREGERERQVMKKIGERREKMNFTQIHE